MEKNKILKAIDDLLKQNGKYSQGRVYLAISVIVYYGTIGVLTVAGIRKSDIDINNFQIIIDALKYAMTLFASYVLGGKIVDVYTAFINKDKDKDKDPSAE